MHVPIFVTGEKKRKEKEKTNKKEAEIRSIIVEDSLCQHLTSTVPVSPKEPTVGEAFGPIQASQQEGVFAFHNVTCFDSQRTEVRG